MYFPSIPNYIRKATACQHSFITICADSLAVGMVIKMKSVLEELYNGNICPSSRSYKSGSEYAQAANSLVEAREKFRSMLDRSQDEAYDDDVLSAQDKVSCLDMNDSFIYGFRMGLMIAVEVYNTSDDFIVSGV